MPKHKNKLLVRAAAALLFVISLSVGILNGTASAESRDLIPMGCTVGIQISTDGVVVVGCSKIETEDGSVSPAQEAGILPGDVILSLNGGEVDSAVDFIQKMGEIEGGDVFVRVRRGDTEHEFTVTPRRGADGRFQLGLWLRDSIAGIGTVTFYDPATGLFGALGHSISDGETGILMPLGEGRIMDATVVDVRKGVQGSPGELCGNFDTDKTRGNLTINTDCGIFGLATDMGGYSGLRLCQTAEESEIVVGEATIISNVRGREICEYRVEIEKVYRGDEKGRSLMLTVTDPKLLEITGGIVQGMSGSPIIQNGKLVGAVTHVLINDPTKGYGISITKMLEKASGAMPLAFSSSWLGWVRRSHHVLGISLAESKLNR